MFWYDEAEDAGIDDVKTLNSTMKNLDRLAKFAKAQKAASQKANQQQSIQQELMRRLG